MLLELFRERSQRAAQRDAHQRRKRERPPFQFKCCLARDLAAIVALRFNRPRILDGLHEVWCARGHAVSQRVRFAVEVGQFLRDRAQSLDVTCAHHAAVERTINRRFQD